MLRSQIHFLLEMGQVAGRCTSTARLDGKTAIITGSNVGIGQYTAQDLYKRGCRVIMACRNEEKAKIAREEIYERTKGVPNVGSLEVATVDVASLQSVREFAERILATEKQIHLLINNAGVVSPKAFTVDGFEVHFGTNHLGHFLLTLLLLPLIISSAPARIINVSSIAHWTAGILDWDDLNAEKTFSTSRNYSVSKLANILFTKELARRLEGSNVNVYVLHPGFVNTDVSRHGDAIAFPGATWCYKNILKYLQKSVKQGAQTTIYCAVDEQAGKETGLYYADCETAPVSKDAKNPEHAKKMWDVSVKLVKLDGYDPFQKLDNIVDNLKAKRWQDQD